MSFGQSIWECIITHLIQVHRLLHQGVWEDSSLIRDRHRNIRCKRLFADNGSRCWEQDKRMSQRLQLLVGRK
ncbi:hypothetical protein YC2023_012696 [Brassica napus]|uniref:Uncharacterized protein n=1 Tax=Brassica oleracea TaxID=3712 RepID=A0A3P6FZS9_BRAOL|nr:unnamed protein product [Brassica oleracea]VDD52664.1 unnamed protein product [Brassica oleracea]